MSNIKIVEHKLVEVGDIKDAMLEKRQLPMGVAEFHAWSERIIGGALVPGADLRSQKFALANLITHLPHTESFKEDAFFIHALRKTAANQVAVAMIAQIKEEFAAESEQKASDTPTIN